MKKAAQKLFRNWAGGRETSTAQFKKVFCFFFSKKKPSSSLPFPPLGFSPQIRYTARAGTPGGRLLSFIGA
ncbi:MAG TPA: hypothetical protein VL356_02020 [Acidocella sp.]|nr:hypothetical protein [Acidocella sp.]